MSCVLPVDRHIFSLEEQLGSFCLPQHKFIASICEVISVQRNVQLAVRVDWRIKLRVRVRA